MTYIFNRRDASLLYLTGLGRLLGSFVIFHVSAITAPKGIPSLVNIPGPGRERLCFFPRTCLMACSALL